jgi:hypothetical protein
MRLGVLHGPAANKLTSDPALIEEVVSTLRDDEPATPFEIEVDPAASPIGSLLLVSDTLPGLFFVPAVYTDPAGQVFIAENYGAVEYHTSGHTVRAPWVPARPALAAWTKTAD